jgi:hypothetical protein
MRKLGATLTAIVLCLLFASQALATHPRPQGATPITASVVPAYKQCTVPNRTHGTPLAFPSCNPPQQTSSWLTVGTPEANISRANMIGRQRFDTIAGAPGPPEDSDIFTSIRITDVRCRAGTSASVCTGFNGGELPDYSGELQSTVVVRIIDHYNGSGLNEAATVVDIPFPTNAQCVANADVTVGASCSVATTFNAIVPGAIKDTQRSVWEMGQVQIFDGGSDGNASTADNTLFAVQGVFVP